jgi:phage terminase large subunit
MDEERREIRLKPHQDDLIYSTAPFPALGGGWGNGKTLAGCARAWMLSNESPGNLGVIARKHFTDLKDSTLADFMALFGASVRFKGGQRPECTLANGSKILFRHADKLGSLTNLNLGWFWIDQAEEVTEDAFLFLRGRLRRKAAKRRSGYVTFNMEGHNWIWRTWLKLLDNEEQALDPADYQLLVSDTLANKDNLPEDYVRQLLKLPERVKQRYVFGSWDVFEGQIYPMFSDQVHVINPLRPKAGWAVFEAGDHGRKNPTCWLWFAVDFQGNVYVFDEHYLAGSTPTTHAEAMKAMRKRYGFEDVAYSVIDPAIEESDLDLYYDAGISLTKGNNDVLAGINLVSEYLAIDPERESPITGLKGSPKLYVTRNCINLIRELHEYQWKVMRNRSSALNEPEAPRKYNDHAVDALRYGLMSRPTTPGIPDDVRPGTNKELIQRHLKIIRAREENSGDPMADFQ